MGVTATPAANGVQVTWTPSGTANVKRSDGAPFKNRSSGMIDNHPPCNCQFYYTVDQKGKSNTIGPVCSTATRTSGYVTLIGFEDTENPFGSFALLVPFGQDVLQYVHTPGEVSSSPWKQVRPLGLFPNEVVLDSSLSLIQSSLRQLEMIACAVPFGQQEGQLLGSDIPSGGSWTQPVLLKADDGPLNQVMGSQALIESFREGQEQFELLVPRRDAIFHYIHRVDSVSNEPWKFVAKLPFPAKLLLDTPMFVSLLQSTSNELIAIASIAGTLFGYVLTQGHNWNGPFEIQSNQGVITRVIGSPAFIQRNDDTFDLVVSQEGTPFHYMLEGNTLLGGQWKFVAKLSPPDNNPQIRTVSLSLTKNADSHLELVTRASDPHGLEKDFMVGYVYDPLTPVWQNATDLRDENGRKIVASNELQPPPGADSASAGQNSPMLDGPGTGQESIS